MRLEYLHEFVELAENLNFSSTAKQLNISQPTLSTHIKSIEKELGLQLFERNRHRVLLTPIGQVFYVEAVEVLARYEHALLAMEQEDPSRDSLLSVGYLHYAFGGVMPTAIKMFNEIYPSVKVRTIVYRYKTITQALCDGTIDIALTLDVDDRLHKFCNRQLMKEDPLCCMVHMDDELAQYNSISLMDLKDSNFILAHPNFSDVFPWFYDSLFDRAGFTPKVTKYYCNTTTRRRYVEAKEGGALVGSHLYREDAGIIKYIRLKEEWCKYWMAALWRKDNRSSWITDFLNILADIPNNTQTPLNQYLVSRTSVKKKRFMLK